MNAREMGKAMRAACSGAVRDTLLIAHQSVTDATPVDTTHAASNWLLSVGSPNYDIAGSREAPDWGPWNSGRKLLMDWDISKGKIYLRNNVPYIGALNNGHSQQAPPNFIELALSGTGIARHMPAGTRRATKTMLRALGRAAIMRRRSR